MTKQKLLLDLLPENYYQQYENKKISLSLLKKVFKHNHKMFREIKTWKWVKVRDLEIGKKYIHAKVYPWSQEYATMDIYATIIK